MKNKPTITIFSGLSVDGKMTMGKNVSSKLWGQLIPSGAIAILQRMRQETDAVMVGGTTVMLDNPGLLRSDATGYRIIIDNSGKLERDMLSYKVFTHKPAQTCVLTSQKAASSYVTKLKQMGVSVHQTKDKKIDFASALEYLAKKILNMYYLKAAEL